MDEENNQKNFKNRKQKKPRTAKPVTADRLGNIALHYLERYASSAENLRRVLVRRIHRSAQLHGADRVATAGDVDALVARYCKAGLLDDQVYSTARATSLHRQGMSLRHIRQTLSVKGVESDVIDDALETLQQEVGSETDLAAAANYARRRRLGPWRNEDRRESYRDRDLASLGRQGFGYDIARRIVSADSVEDIEQELAE